MPDLPPNPDPGVRIPDLPKPRETSLLVILLCFLGLAILAGVAGYVVFKEPVNRLRAVVSATQATILPEQGKLAEAEQEHRAELAMRERVLGPEHQDVFSSGYNLAFTLWAAGKGGEALGFARRAEEGRKTVLGVEHPDYRAAKALREEIEEELRKL